MLMFHGNDNVQVQPWWLATQNDAFDKIVDKWCSEEWLESHRAGKAKRQKMPGKPHHQGSRNLAEFSAAYVRQMTLVL